MTKGGMCGRGACMAEGCAWGGLHGRRDSHCSGRYASYWNAFLFSRVFDCGVLYILNCNLFSRVWEGVERTTKREKSAADGKRFECSD